MHGHAQAAHDDRNLARKLTPAEKRDKKLKKLFDDSDVEIVTSVYKVGGHLPGVLALSDRGC